MPSEPVIYSIRRDRRARQIILTVHPDCRVVLTAPPGIPGFMISRHVRKNEAWIRKQLADLGRYSDCIFLPGGRQDYLQHKERARTRIHECLGRYNAIYGHKFGRVSVKNMRRNWGSCSAKGNLNFNYKLVHLPERLAEYVVVHELCHLAEMNHSKCFWELVSRSIPDHKARRKALRKYLM